MKSDFFDPKEFPMRVEIELTNDCNSYCTYCPRKYMRYEIGYMSLKLYQRLIDEISTFHNRTLVLFRRGESLLHPEFLKMLFYAKGKFKEIQLATNVSLMNKNIANAIAECVSFISFSIELPENYGSYRKLDYNNVLNNINYFLSINKKVKTQVSMVDSYNIDQEYIERFRNQWINRVDRVRIYEEHSSDGRFGSLKNSMRKRKPCVKPFSDILIFWDGMVGRCNHDWGEKPLDSIVNKSIQKVWDSSTYNSLRKQHLSLSITDEVCSKCDSWYEKIDMCDIGLVYEKSTKRD